ncbi:SDR family oxidoreductase [Alicyclobacillaceae bacterium I2511]|nr:SDR family oxidoreductase [Alicyclobacillaceae bacterium I2511]
MEGRVAFVTSGAKGLGNITVRLLIDAGWNVCFTYLSSAVLAHELADYAAKKGRVALGQRVDLLNRAQVLQAVAGCRQQFMRIDALVHNFGPFVFERVPLAEYSEEMWSRMMNGNLNNFFWLYHAIAQDMRRQKFGRIITMGYEGAGQAAGWRHRAAYGAAKSALAQMTRSIAREERENGLTANMVCPGDIRGSHKMQRIDEVYAVPQGAFRETSVGEDVARVIVFLCDENSQYINGTVTEVTGGYEIRARDEGI